LALCADAGLATVGVIAVDGTKVHANAGRDRSRSYEDIARAMVEEVVATDTAETAAFGDRRGDERPELVTRREAASGGCAMPVSAWTSVERSIPSRSRGRA
jgi:hypothetical protein